MYAKNCTLCGLNILKCNDIDNNVFEFFYVSRKNSYSKISISVTALHQNKVDSLIRTFIAFSVL